MSVYTSTSSQIKLEQFEQKINEILGMNFKSITYEEINKHNRGHNTTEGIQLNINCHKGDQISTGDMEHTVWHCSVYSFYYFYSNNVMVLSGFKVVKTSIRKVLKALV